MSGTLTLVSDKYALPGLAGDPRGFSLPDDVIRPLVDAFFLVSPNLFPKHAELSQQGLVPALNRQRILIETPKVPWDQSCKLVVQALQGAAPFLGERAQGVVEATRRWKRAEVEPGDAWGVCHFPPDPARGKAWIEIGADGTISDALCIAHEMGHLLAGDLSQERRLLGADYVPRQHMSELQGYFAQHMLYDYLMNDPRAAFLKDEAQRHFIGEITRSIYKLVVGALALDAHHQFERGMTEAALDKQTIEYLKRSLGPGWEAFEPAILLVAHETDDPYLIQLSRDIHGHAAAAVIGAGVHEGYKNGDAAKREAIIEALYCGGARHTILDVLGAVGVTAENIDQFMIECVEIVIGPFDRLYKDSRRARRA